MSLNTLVSSISNRFKLFDQINNVDLELDSNFAVIHRSTMQQKNPTINLILKFLFCLWPFVSSIKRCDQYVVNCLSPVDDHHYVIQSSRFQLPITSTLTTLLDLCCDSMFLFRWKYEQTSSESFFFFLKTYVFQSLR